MFEKVAEEYRKNLNSKFFLSKEQLDFACQGFKDGYNKVKKDADKMKSRFLELCNLKDMRIEELEKANKWHFVKDGDLPKDDKDMLMSEQLILLKRMKGTDNLSISIGQYNFSTQEFSYPHFVGLTDVIAWKEIVLPKEN